MIFKDYYKILQLKTNKVSTHQIKIAYREQAKKYHPDVNVGSKLAEERFKDINEAYKILSNPSEKRKYDRKWYRYVGSKNEYKEEFDETTSMKKDFFAMFFGQARNNEIDIKSKSNKKNAVRGEDVETGIEITLEEAFYGMTKKISLRTVNGDMKTFSVKIPAGIRNNEKIRLIGQGKSGKNGGKNGDLFIKVSIQDNAKFKLDRYDIHVELLITPWEAALGTKAKLNGIDEEMTIDVPAGTQSGDKIRISEKGYKNAKGRKRRFNCRYQNYGTSKINAKRKRNLPENEANIKIQPTNCDIELKQVNIKTIYKLTNVRKKYIIMYSGRNKRQTMHKNIEMRCNKWNVYKENILA